MITNIYAHLIANYLLTIPELASYGTFTSSSSGSDKQFNNLYV